MYKILHFSLHKHIPAGVIHQLVAEQRSAKQLPAHIEWQTVVFSHDKSGQSFVRCVPGWEGGTVRRITNYIKLRKAAYRWLLQNMENYDAVILRYRPGDFYLWLISFKFKNVFTIHHTKELEEAKSRYGQGGRIEAFAENCVARGILGRAKGFIGVTQEIVDYEKSRFGGDKSSYCYPNGINMEDIKIAADARKGCPRIIFVASRFSAWHGLDRIVTEFRESSADFILHVVGRHDLKEPIDDDRIIFHGQQERPYIENLMQECDIGLGSFALESIGLSEACHLKVREYLAAGLPVYSGYPDSGLPEIFLYYKKGEPVADAILSYARDCRNVDRKTVRQAAFPYIDKGKIMQSLVDWLEKS